MIQDEYLTEIQEKLNKNPFVSLKSLEKKLSYPRDVIYKSIHELSRNGNKNAQLWVETAPFRRYTWTFRYALQLLDYIFEHELTIADLEGMDLWGWANGYSENRNILSILNLKRYMAKRDKTLLSCKNAAMELMKIFSNYDIGHKEISNTLREYKNLA